MTKEEIIQMYIYDLKSKAVQTEATISVIKTLEHEQEICAVDGDYIWCKSSEMSRDNFAEWYDDLILNK